jgi:hydroxymethylbilane synthase
LAKTPHIRIGTRGSQLALWQANWVADQLRQRGATVDIIEISTAGDRDQRDPILEMNQQGVFTKEIQAAVLTGAADIAVHSLKDLPTETVEGLILCAVPPREVCFDVLITTKAKSLMDLPPNARVGTGSLRRQAQLRHLRSDLEILGIRGNVDTRLRKLRDGEFDAIVLAAAGVKRLNLDQQVVEELAPPRMLPAPGQGALGIECHRAAHDIIEFVSQLDDANSRDATNAERSMLALLHAGCSAPVGAWGRIENGELLLDGVVATLDGRQVLRASASGSSMNASELGKSVAQSLLEQGAGRIIAAAKQGYP